MSYCSEREFERDNYLEPALDQIKGGDHGVGDTAREETAKTAVGIVGAASELAGVLFNSCSSYKLSVAGNKIKIVKICPAFATLLSGLHIILVLI